MIDNHKTGFRLGIVLIILALLTVVLLTGCGGESEPAATTTVTTTTAAEAPPKTFNAYDNTIMAGAEREIKAQMHQIARDNPGDEEQLTVQCIADTERSFSCGLSTKMSYPDGIGGKLCTDIEGEAKGTVDPSTGETDWKVLNSQSDDEPSPCY